MTADPRLYLDDRLAQGSILVLDGPALRYLAQVMRLRADDDVRVFNGRDGEWRATIREIGRRAMNLVVQQQLRPALVAPGPLLAIAPIRPSRLEWVAEKAVELGVGALAMVLTERTVVRPERADRLRGIVREAAEQCERLDLPPVSDPMPVLHWLAARDQSQRLLLADETGGQPVMEALVADGPPPAMLVGPEGGFTALERRTILAAGGIGVSLGPNILRTETAGLAMMAAWRLRQSG